MGLRAPAFKRKVKKKSKFYIFLKNNNKRTDLAMPKHSSNAIVQCPVSTHARGGKRQSHLFIAFVFIVPFAPTSKAHCKIAHFYLNVK